jgi:hypothetical protein
VELQSPNLFGPDGSPTFACMPQPGTANPVSANSFTSLQQTYAANLILGRGLCNGLEKEDIRLFREREPSLFT